MKSVVDSIVFDDGVRMTDTIQIRVPHALRESLRTAAAADGITVTEYARRAIAERIARRAEEARLATTPHPEVENDHG